MKMSCSEIAISLANILASAADSLDYIDTEGAAALCSEIQPDRETAERFAAACLGDNWWNKYGTDDLTQFVEDVFTAYDANRSKVDPDAVADQYNARLRKIVHGPDTLYARLPPDFLDFGAECVTEEGEDRYRKLIDDLLPRYATLCGGEIIGPHCWKGKFTELCNINEILDAAWAKFLSLDEPGLWESDGEDDEDDEG